MINNILTIIKEQFFTQYWLVEFNYAAPAIFTGEILIANDSMVIGTPWHYTAKSAHKFAQSVINDNVSAINTRVITRITRI